ncbi:MAG: hypothetical protein HGB27_02905 [Chlorobiaceae bacterium]|nr:hypothetical protein [Chlorobiaceae bacterium]
MKKQVVVLSDIHIGDNSPTCWYQSAIHDEYLITVLDAIADNAAAVRELVLLGDVVDMWTYPFDAVPPTFAEITAKNPAIFSQKGVLARVLDALDGAVTYIPGNHDMAVTEADVASITSPGGHRLRYARQFYNPAGDSRVLMTHGHEFTLFNAPDPATMWAPLPVGHFVTRSVATYWKSHLKPGQNVSDLKDQGYPNGIDVLSIIKHALKSLDVSLSDALIDGIAGKLGISESAPIRITEHQTTTLSGVKQAYKSLFSRWITENGGGEDGLLVATKAAMADYDSSFMGWFAQREAFRRNADLVVLGHTHASVSKLRTSMVNYVNTGFMCPSSADMPGRFVSYATVSLDSPPVVKNMQAVRRGGGIAVNPFEAPSASIVVEPCMDFSCYVRVDNSPNTKDLWCVGTEVGHGHFVELPRCIKAGSFSTLWLQDYPNLVPPHGSDATVTYRDDGGTVATFNFDCPTGIYPNSCSGGSGFQAKAGDGPWLPPGQVPSTGHPLFVRFSVTPGSVAGTFKGACGVNSFAVSATGGLNPGENVVLNGKTDLSDCMVANDDAKVFGIRLDKTSGVYEYCLRVDAQGPKGMLSGSMYLYFTDQSGDRYLLTVFDHARKMHTLQYNSCAPAIMKIEWSNTAK